MQTADERAAEAIAITPDATSRTSIARARHRCAVEADSARSALRDLAGGRLTSTSLALMESAVSRLRRLAGRMGELDAMAKAALQAQVDADPELAGATVLDDGTIREGSSPCPPTASPELEGAVRPEQGPECYACETTGYNCLAHRPPAWEG